jgi:hypothetical protein
MTNTNTFKVSAVKTAYHSHSIVRQDVIEWKYLKSKPVAFRYKDRKKSHCADVLKYYEEHPDRTQWFIYEAKKSWNLIPVKAWYDSTWTLIVWDDK